MEITGYGILNKKQNATDEDRHIEELSIQGFTILKSVINAEELQITRKKLDEVYAIQENAFGKENLVAIKELDMARCPLAYDDYFLSIALHHRITKLVEKLIGNYYILHLQNGIINRPNLIHHQSSWHRDLPYQDFVISKPLALSALWCIDPFNEKTGGTLAVPFTHKLDALPSAEYVEKYSVTVNTEAGDDILFDSMLYHRSGSNTSDMVRRGINNIYTTPILKQQINIQTATNNKYSNDAHLSKFLGYETNIAENVDNYRNARLNRNKK